MKLSHILIKNFRNIGNREILFKDKMMLNGVNGSGKTSIIEAAYISFTGKSFRTSNLKEIINKETNFFFVRTNVSDMSGYNREFSIGFDELGQKKILIDGNAATRKELMNVAVPVIHSPEDMEIISGGPKKRRDFIDKICFMENKSYFDDFIEYNRYVKQKNMLLKKGDAKTLSYINNAAVPLIKKIRDLRKTACSRINDEFRSYNSDIFPELELTISTQHDENIAEKLQSKIPREMEKGFALYGPHVDIISVKTALGESRTNVSMGESYLISLVLKMAELSLYSKKELYPVFFIDDIFVYLDKKRKTNLYEKIVELKNQVIMTSAIETSCDFKQISFLNIANGEK